MTRLQDEHHRLYGIAPASSATGLTRFMVLELHSPADWAPLAEIWESVQTDWDWPAPGIAVSGSDGMQLWFSFAQPLPATEAQDLLTMLCQRHLADVVPTRIRCRTHLHANSQEPAWPPVQVTPDRWSAFVSRDLASVFGSEPWLDMPPGEEAQADLLSRLRSMTPANATAPRAIQPKQSQPDLPSAIGIQKASHLVAMEADPRQFLLKVMNNPTVDMATRVEAAKALLTVATEPPPPQRPSR